MVSKDPYSFKGYTKQSFWQTGEQLTENAVPTQNLPATGTQEPIEHIDQLLEAKQLHVEFAVPTLQPQIPDQLSFPRIFYCRLCANPQHESDTIDLRANFFQNNETNVFQFLSSFLEMSEEDDSLLPTSICRVCASKLNETLRFKTECIRATARLKLQCFGNTVENMQNSHIKEIKKESIGHFEFISTYAGVQTDVDDLEETPTDTIYMDPNVFEEEPMEIEIDSTYEPLLMVDAEPRWKCLLCNRVNLKKIYKFNFSFNIDDNKWFFKFTASKAEVQRHYPKCKSFYNRFVKNKLVVKTENKSQKTRVSLD
jgi:hypothetical protein